MTYPAEPLQRAVYDRLMTDDAVKAVMGGTARVYDAVPRGAEFPYVTIGAIQCLDDGTTCDDNAYEAFTDIQVWSRSVGQIEAKQLAGAVRAALAKGLSPLWWRVSAIHCQSITHFMDPDGLTARARVSMRFLVEPA